MPTAPTSIVIVEASELWAGQFETLAVDLRETLADAALRIDHIGSTAVPGLAAKDVIDVQVTVADLDRGEVTERLLRAGYAHRTDVDRDSLVGLDPSSPELRKQLFRERQGERRAHIHVREQGRINQLYPLLFRDFLRADPVVREAYAIVKLELAARFPKDLDAYYAVKDPYMDTVYRAARLWMQLSNWAPDDDFR